MFHTFREVIASDQQKHVILCNSPVPTPMLVRRLVCEGYRCIMCRLGFMTQFSMALDEAFKRIREKNVLKWFGNRIHCQSHAFIIFKMEIHQCSVHCL